MAAAQYTAALDVARALGGELKHKHAQAPLSCDKDYYNHVMRVDVT